MTTEPYELKPGVESGKRNVAELAEAVAKLEATVEKYLPEGVLAINNATQLDGNLVLHQDAFASGYHFDEYVLLGMAIKYAGLRGVNVMIVGTNHETF